MAQMYEKIALRTHATRGTEVIGILEEMGGLNKLGLVGNSIYCDGVYYIDKRGIIIQDFAYNVEVMGYTIYTLEEWEERKR